MIYRTLYLILMILFVSCSRNTKHEPIKIVIKLNESYKYDLSTGEYSIFYLNKPPTIINFHLSEQEINEIQSKYYSLDVDKIKRKGLPQEKIVIEDNCDAMPKDVSILKVQTKETKKEIQIDLYCNSYSLSNSHEANKLKGFIKFVMNILQSKPEIKNAPKSNVLYM